MNLTGLTLPMKWFVLVSVNQSWPPLMVGHTSAAQVQNVRLCWFRVKTG